MLEREGTVIIYACETCPNIHAVYATDETETRIRKGKHPPRPAWVGCGLNGCLGRCKPIEVHRCSIEEFGRIKTDGYASVKDALPVADWEDVVLWEKAVVSPDWVVAAQDDELRRGSTREIGFVIDPQRPSVVTKPGCPCRGCARERAKSRAQGERVTASQVTRRLVR